MTTITHFNVEDDKYLFRLTINVLVIGTSVIQFDKDKYAKLTNDPETLGLFKHAYVLCRFPTLATDINILEYMILDLSNINLQTLAVYRTHPYRYLFHGTNSVTISRL